MFSMPCRPAARKSPPGQAQASRRGVGTPTSLSVRNRALFGPRDSFAGLFSSRPLAGRDMSATQSPLQKALKP